MTFDIKNAKASSLPIASACYPQNRPVTYRVTGVTFRLGASEWSHYLQ